MYINVRSLPKNYDDVGVVVRNRKPNLVFLSETRLTEDIENKEVNIKQYKLLRCDSHTRATGGVAMYVKRGVNYEVVSNECIVNNMWILAIKVKNPNMKGTYAVLYHSPSTSDSEFIDLFEKWCEENVNHEELITICGDFNVNLMTRSTYSNKISNVIRSMGLKQIISDPTRVTETSRSLIDYVITNDYNMNATVLLSDKITDHSTIVFNVGSVKVCKGKSVEKLIDYAKEVFVGNLLRIEWEKSYCLEPNDKLDFLSNHLKNCISEFIKVVKKSNKNSKVWYNQNLEEQRKRRDKLYKVAYITCDQNDWHIYVDESKDYAWNVKVTKNDFYYNKLLSAKSDQKKTWKLLKKMINGETEETSEYIEFNGEKVHDDAIIADRFNDYFVNSIKDINSSIPVNVNDEAKDDLDEIEVANELKFRHAEISDVERILNEIKSKGDSEHLNKDVLKDALSVVGLPILDAINSSLEFGTVAKSWKNSMVIPTPKVIGTRKYEEFRPINMLPTYEKVLEGIVKQQLNEHVDANEVLIDEYNSDFGKTIRVKRRLT